MSSSIYGTRLYFSGVESRRLLDTFTSFQIPFVQLSYYYLRKVFGEDMEALVQHLKQFEGVVLDHGLVYHKYKSEPEKQAFLEDYYHFVAKLPARTYDGVVTHKDLTLDKIIDERKLIYPLDDLEELFDGDTNSIFSTIEYVGIGNKVANSEDRMGALCSQAEKAGARIHCFGVASQRILKRWPIYSANTSSWRTGSRYANTYIYEGIGKGLKLYQPSDKSDLDKTAREKRTIRHRLEKRVLQKQETLHGLIDWEKLLEDDDSWEVDKANLTQWKLYQKDLELDSRKAYWLSTEEKHLLSLRKQDYLLSISGTTEPNKTNRESSSDIPGPRGSNNSVIDREEEDSKSSVLEGEVVADGTSKEITNIQSGPITAETQGKQRLRSIDERLLSPRKCDDCILANRCPKYEMGASCYFGLTDSYNPATLDTHVDEDVADLLAMQKDRVLQGYLEEKSDASGLSKDLTNNIRLYLEMVSMYNEANSISFKQEAKIKGTGMMQLFKPKS